jgi:hypothetical protein
VLVPSLASAQLDRGQISGLVKDESGGVIPGATITATHTQTGTVRTAITDGTGYYVFTALTPGLYEIVVELQGFKKFMQSAVPMDAGASLRLDATLQTGTINESVTVIAKSTPLLTDATLRKTVEAKDIELLSFSGRNPIGVVGLKAGVVGGAFNSRNFDDLGNGGFNINGSRTDETGSLPRRAARLLRDALQRDRAARRRRVCVERGDRRAGQRGHLPQPRDAQRLNAARRQPAVPADGDGGQRDRGQPGRRIQRRDGSPVRHAGPGHRVQASDVVHVVGGRPARAAVRAATSAT